MQHPFLVKKIFSRYATAYNAMASEASMSSRYSGIHFRSDCEVGSVMYKNVDNYAVQRAFTDGAE